MAEQDVMDKAQEMLDNLILRLDGYAIPASHTSLTFFESILNDNGFSNVHINIDSAATMMPVVTSASRHGKLFNPEAMPIIDIDTSGCRRL